MEENYLEIKGQKISLPDIILALNDSLEKEKNKNQKLIKKVKIDKPLVDFAKTVMQSEKEIDMLGVAGILNMGIGRTRLFQILRDKKILRQNNQPYWEYINRGYFKIIIEKFNIETEYGVKNKLYYKTVVFPKGIEFIRKILLELNKKRGI